MKSKLRILFLILCLVSFQDANAQLFKKLKKRAKEKAKNIENKVVNKVDEEVDKTVDGALEGRGNPNQGKPTPQTENAKKDFGDITINHSQKYGSVAITETSQVKVSKTNSGYTISGNWWSHQADIYDGFNITIKTDQDLKNTTDTQKRTFKIPEEATMQLGYDPQLPYNKKTEDNFVRAVTNDYQNYDVLKGEVTVTVLSDAKVQISFSGTASLRTVIRKANSDDFSESFYEASISGTLDGESPKFISAETIIQTNTTQNNSDSGYSITPTTSGTAPTPGIYQFSYETVNRITVPKQDRTYKISYLINPNADYVAMKMDMSDYSEAEMTGESIIVTDKGNAHIFVESAGMKLRMSNGMMGQKMENPTDQMANHDYGKLTKTGNTKTILGATCHEYSMSDSNTKVSIWVAPSIQLPNWFVKNTSLVNGHIMEYTVDSSEGNMKSEVIEIKKNINKTINPKEYRKMF